MAEKNPQQQMDLVDQNAKERMLVKIKEKLDEKKQRKIEIKQEKIEQRMVTTKADFTLIFGDVFEQHCGLSKSDLKDFPPDELSQLNSLLETKVNKCLIYKYLPSSLIFGTSIGLSIMYFGLGLLHLIWALPISALFFIAIDGIAHGSDEHRTWWTDKILKSLESRILKIPSTLKYYYYVQILKKHYGQNYFPIKDQPRK